MTEYANIELLNRLMALEARVEEIDDDFPEPEASYGGERIGWATDYCFVGRVKVIIPENTNGYEFLQINLGESPSAVWVAALPDIQPENAVVFQITGRPRIYLSGEFA